MSKNIIIVAAGGNGRRMRNKVNKIFFHLRGIPIIFYTLKTLEKSPVIDEILITVRKENFMKIKKLIKRSGFKKIKKIIPANHSRQQSTWRALKWLEARNTAKNSLVGVHNAVNPLVKEEEIKEVFKAACRWGAALLAIQAKDTVKIVGKNSLVLKTPIRNFVWYAQTPQVARFDLLFKAFKKASQLKDWGTDDTMLLERLKIKIKIIPCSSENFKITYPLDLILAEEILKRRENV